jgi:hypothetical protein
MTREAETPGNPMEVMREVADLISRLERSGERELDAASRAALERLLSLAQGLDRSDVESLGAGSAPLAAIYGRYVQQSEAKEAKALIEREADGGALARGEGGDFAGRSYARVRDMFGRIDFTTCREFAMVGCGPLPATLLHVAERTGVPRIVGLDVDAGSVHSAREICGRWSPSRIDVLLRHGSAHDYGSAQIVYLANLIRPKAAVLARVAETVRPGTQVVVREPFEAGCLFAESGVDPLDPRLKLLARGPGDRRFLSRHVFLERMHENPTEREHRREA